MPRLRGTGSRASSCDLVLDVIHSAPFQRNLFTHFLQLWSRVSSPNTDRLLCVSSSLLTQTHEWRGAAPLRYKSLIKCSAVFPSSTANLRSVLAAVDVYLLRCVISFETWKTNAEPCSTSTAHGDAGSRKYNQKAGASAIVDISANSHQSYQFSTLTLV